MSARPRAWWGACAWALSACANAAPSAPHLPHEPLEAPAAPRRPRVLTVIGTSDLHGHLEALPWLGGYLHNLRRAAAARGDAVLLLDAGDMFQGTLESNGVEGESVVRAYNELGYDAVAVGNHEFDFGPVGPAVSVPRAAWADEPNHDPRGALRARAAQSALPFLLANVEARPPTIALSPIRPSAQREVSFGDGSRVRIGVVGASTAETAQVTLGANVADLHFGEPGAAIAKEAAALRGQGVQLVFAAAHAGASCERFGGTLEADACDDGESFQIARAVPTLDALVGGHTHAGVAHLVGDVPVIQSFAYGVAFGRVDLTLDAADRVIDRKVHAPRFLCANSPRAVGKECEPGEYEGARVRPAPAVQALVDGYFEQARAQRTAKVGVTLLDPIERSYDKESALGNLFADAARRSGRADVGLYNGGGLRDRLPAGELEYGALHAALPFDNVLVRAELSVAQLRHILLRNYRSRHGILSVSGVHVRVRCVAGELKLQLWRADERGRARGAELRDAQRLSLATSDFLLGGGDDFAGLPRLASSQQPLLLREAVARELVRRGRLGSAELFDAQRPRAELPEPRPLQCAAL